MLGLERVRPARQRRHGLTSARLSTCSASCRFGALAVGWNHSCGITVGGDLYCWGSNNGGQLGDGTRRPPRADTRYHIARFVSVAAGNQHTCAVTTTADSLRWGETTTDNWRPGPAIAPNRYASTSRAASRP